MTARGRLLSALWIPLAAIAALVLVPPGTTLLSSYALRWYAVALVLLAVVGRTRRWAAISTATLSAAGGIAVSLRAGYLLVANNDPMYSTLIAGGLIVAILGAVQLVRLLRAHRPWDPVMFTAIQLGTGLIANWAYSAPALFRLNPLNYHVVTWSSPFVGELPILTLAFAAVGLGLSRSWRPGLQRLGITRPAWWQPFLAVLVACFFLMLVPVTNHLTFVLTPRLYFAVGAISYWTYYGASLEILLVIAVMAGICEEALFRGALQQRAGIIVTAALFASIHTQYFLTPILGMVFAHGLVLGLLRRHLNTTTAMIAHGTYDLIGNFRLGTGGWAILALLMVAVLARPAVTHRHAIWRSVRETLANDWSGFWRRGPRSLPQPLA
jgi:membrane protease YdiL (CAAX protease family)